MIGGSRLGSRRSCSAAMQSGPAWRSCSRRRTRNQRSVADHRRAGDREVRALGDAVDAAADMTVLRVRGIESESELPFAGLAELMRPALRHRRGLPAPQVAALEAAFALGPPAAVDRFTAYVGALSLLAAVAERSPGPRGRRRRALAGRGISGGRGFRRPAARAGGRCSAARRTNREGHGLDGAGVPELALGGLDLAASHALLVAAAEPVDPAVATRLVDATGGNPLALLEVAAVLSPAQRAGIELIEDPVPVGATAERTFGRALGALPGGTRRALLIAAVSESGAIAEVAQALAASGIGAGALEEAERAGLVTIADGTLSFRHPLLRSVAYRALPAPDRRAAHRLIAEAVSGPRSAERRAWHRAAASPGPDAAVAASLAEAAAAARVRGGPAAAAPASERAARLTPDCEQRARRLLQAAGTG